MSAAQRNQFHTGNVYHRGIVECTKCKSPIYVRTPNTTGDEFSVPCPRCGTRGLYSKRAMLVEEVPDRRKKPRR